MEQQEQQQQQPQQQPQQQQQRSSSRDALIQHLAVDARRDVQFLLPIGAAQLISAGLWLLVSVLAGAASPRTSAVSLQLLGNLTSFLLHAATAATLLLASRAARLRQLRRLATGSLALCALSGGFAVTQIHRQLERSAGALLNSGSGSGSGRMLQHRAVLLLLLLLQCVIAAFAGYLCVRLVWTATATTTTGDEADEADGREAAAAAAAAAADAEELPAAVAEVIEMKARIH